MMNKETAFSCHHVRVWTSLFAVRVPIIISETYFPFPQLCTLDTPLALLLAHPLLSVLDYPKLIVCHPAEAQLYLPYTVTVADSPTVLSHSAAQLQREADAWCDYWRVERVKVSAVGAGVGLDDDVVELIHTANDVRLQVCTSGVNLLLL